MNTHMDLPTAANINSPKGSNPNWLAAGGKFHSLAQALLVVVLGGNALMVRAKVDYTGTWFTCEAKQLAGQRSPYSTLNISQVNNEYVWLNEIGVANTQNGIATVNGASLLLKGCAAHRGVDSEKCNRDNPPLVRKLNAKFFTTYVTPTRSALLNGKAIRITKNITWEQLGARCEALADEISEKKNTWRLGSDPKCLQLPLGAHCMGASL